MISENKCNPRCNTIASLNMIVDTAKYKALRNRHNPWLGEIHTQYAEVIKSVIDAEENITHA